jgi:hypothetical protein
MRRILLLSVGRDSTLGPRAAIMMGSASWIDFMQAMQAMVWA